MREEWNDSRLLVLFPRASPRASVVAATAVRVVRVEAAVVEAWAVVEGGGEVCGVGVDVDVQATLGATPGCGALG